MVPNSILEPSCFLCVLIFDYYYCWRISGVNILHDTHIKGHCVIILSLFNIIHF